MFEQPELRIFGGRFAQGIVTPRAGTVLLCNEAFLQDLGTRIRRSRAQALHRKGSAWVCGRPHIWSHALVGFIEVFAEALFDGLSSHPNIAAAVGRVDDEVEVVRSRARPEQRGRRISGPAWT